MNPHKAIHDFLLKPNEVNVWLFHLDDLDWINLKWRQLLSEEERERSRKYKFEIDRQRFLARRCILRLLMNRYSEMPLDKIIYQVNQHGKLSLPASRISFNLSSSQGWVTYVFALDSDVGVDLEQVRPMPDMIRVAKHCFSMDEQTDLFNLPSKLQTDAFYHIWTQKEAFIKARGEGLAYPLKDFSVSVDPKQPARLLSIKNEPEERHCWRMANGIFDGEWRVAMCTRMDVEPRVVWFKPILKDFLAGLHPSEVGLG